VFLPVCGVCLPSIEDCRPSDGKAGDSERSSGGDTGAEAFPLPLCLTLVFLNGFVWAFLFFGGGGKSCKPTLTGFGLVFGDESGIVRGVNVCPILPHQEYTCIKEPASFCYCTHRIAYLKLMELRAPI
jgi:hypothetical protein